MTRDVDIPADGSAVFVPLGVFKYLAIRTAPVAFQISFDGWNWETANQNNRWDKSLVVPPPEKVHVRALNQIAATITLEWDTNPISAQDTAQSIILNSAIGCGGSGVALNVPAAKLADGVTNYAYDGANPVDLTKNNLIYIPGTRNGKKRKSITFDNRSGTADVIIFGEDGSLLHRLVSADTRVLQLDTSADLYVGGNAGASTKFIYSELFYDLANS